MPKTLIANREEDHQNHWNHTITSTTSFLTATTLIYAVGAGITAAAGHFQLINSVSLFVTLLEYRNDSKSIHGISSTDMFLSKPRFADLILETTFHTRWLVGISVYLKPTQIWMNPPLSTRYRGQTLLCLASGLTLSLWKPPPNQVVLPLSLCLPIQSRIPAFLTAWPRYEERWTRRICDQARLFLALAASF